MAKNYMTIKTTRNAKLLLLLNLRYTKFQRLSD